jgi:hypothetical protein
MTDHTMFNAALDLARIGLPVFPLVAHGKEPRFKGSFHNATTDQTRRFRWKRLNKVPIRGTLWGDTRIASVR